MPSLLFLHGFSLTVALQFVIAKTDLLDDTTLFCVHKLVVNLYSKRINRLNVTGLGSGNETNKWHR